MFNLPTPSCALLSAHALYSGDDDASNVFPVPELYDCAVEKYGFISLLKIVFEHCFHVR